MLLNECSWVNWGMLGDILTMGTLKRLYFYVSMCRNASFSFICRVAAKGFTLGPFTTAT